MFIVNRNGCQAINFDDIERIWVEGSGVYGLTRTEILSAAYSGESATEMLITKMRTQEEAEIVFERIMQTYSEGELICYVGGEFYV